MIPQAIDTACIEGRVMSLAIEEISDDQVEVVLKQFIHGKADEIQTALEKSRTTKCNQQLGSQTRLTSVGGDSERPKF